MIDIRNVTKSYLTNAGRHFVFRNLSFTFNGDRNIALLGANGAGKSTLIRMLGGVETPDAGRIVTGGKRLSWPVNFSSTAQATLSGRDAVKFVCRILGVEGLEREEKLSFVNEFAALGEAFDKAVKSYSSGMRSRLVFAMTMAFDFDYYLIDEVTAVGDTAFKEKSRSILREKMKSANIIVVSHNMKMVREFCDEVVLLSDGVLSAYKDLEEGIRAYQGSGYRPPKSRGTSAASRLENAVAGAWVSPGPAAPGGSGDRPLAIMPTTGLGLDEQPAGAVEKVRRQSSERESPSAMRRKERRRAKRNERAKSTTMGGSQGGAGVDHIVSPPLRGERPRRPIGLVGAGDVLNEDAEDGTTAAKGLPAGASRRVGRKGGRRGQAQVKEDIAKKAGATSAAIVLSGGVPSAGVPSDDARGRTGEMRRGSTQSSAASVSAGERAGLEPPRHPGPRRGGIAHASERKVRGDRRRQASEPESPTVATASVANSARSSQRDGAPRAANRAVPGSRSANQRNRASESKPGSSATGLSIGPCLTGTRRMTSARARRADTNTKETAERLADPPARHIQVLAEEVARGPAGTPGRQSNTSAAAEGSREAGTRNGSQAGAIQGRSAKAGAVRRGERAEKNGRLSNSGNASTAPREERVARKLLRERRARDEVDRLRSAAVIEAARPSAVPDLQATSDVNGSRPARTRKNGKVKGLPARGGRQT